MFEQNNSTFSATNFDLELLSKHCKLFIPENRYIEFYEDFYACQKKHMDYNAIYYIIEGGGWIETENDKIPIEPGNIYLYPADMPEDYKITYFAGTKKVLIMFMLNIFSYHDIFSKIKEVRCLKDEMNLIPLIHQSVTSSSVSKQIILPSLVMLSISPLLQKLEEIIKEKLLKGKNYSLLFEYIDNNLYINLTLKDISNHSGLSVSTLSHVVPKKFGFTVKKYIQRSILKNVSFDLFFTDMRLKDIAAKYGFGSEAHFSKWFYSQKGLRPKDFRKTNPKQAFGSYKFIES